LFAIIFLFLVVRYFLKQFGIGSIPGGKLNTECPEQNILGIFNFGGINFDVPILVIHRHWF
jgi:hypothetical protein